ncbi:MAG: hypothetical protein V3U87_16195 [Methylococcaceae bacterium]
MNIKSTIIAIASLFVVTIITMPAAQATYGGGHRGGGHGGGHGGRSGCRYGRCGGGGRGSRGPAGPQGPAGPSGSDGAMGPAGPAGADGAVGPAGPAGADGAVGPAGSAGADGAAGPAGPAGADGAEGPAGPAGGAGGLTTTTNFGECSYTDLTIYEHGSVNSGVCSLSCGEDEVLVGGGCRVGGTGNGVLTTNQPSGNAWECDFVNLGSDTKAPNFDVKVTTICVSQ